MSQSSVSAYKLLGGGRVDVSLQDISFMTPAEHVQLGSGFRTKCRNPMVYYDYFNDVDLGRFYSKGREPGNLTPTITGMSIEFTNSSDHVMIIRWAESALAVNNYSGVPFLDGMVYRDAGNPAATPDTVIAPGQTILRTVFFSTVTLGSYSYINGALIPKTNDLVLTLTLKIIDNNGAYKYYTLKSPPIGVISGNQ